MMKKISILLALLLLFTSFTACSSPVTATPTTTAAAPATGSGTTAPATPATGEVFHLKFAHSVAETHVIHDTALLLKKLLEEKSGGRITMDVFGSAQLGADRETLEGMQRGDIAFTCVNVSPIVMFVPEFAIFDLPFLIPAKEDIGDTMRTANEIFDGPAGRAILDTLDSRGLIGHKFFAAGGYRELTANKAIHTLEDLKGLKVRTMENKNHIDMWKALGANPTPMALSELFTALEQNTVDGEENPYDLIYTQKFYEVQKYIINTNHIFNAGCIPISKAIYNSMPEDLQLVVMESLDEAMEFLRQGYIDNCTEFYNILDAEVEIIDLEQSEMDRMKEATASVWDSVRASVGNDALIDGLLGEIDKAFQ